MPAIGLPLAQEPLARGSRRQAAGRQFDEEGDNDEDKQHSDSDRGDRSHTQDQFIA